MKVEIDIDIEDYNIGYSFRDDEGNELKFEELPYGDQVMILNSFAQGYEFWRRFLNTKED